MVPEPDDRACSDRREEVDSVGRWCCSVASSAARPPHRVHVQEAWRTEGRSVPGNVEMWKDSRAVSMLSVLVTVRRKLLCVFLQSLVISLIISNLAFAFSALTLLVGWQEGHPASKN